MADTKAYSAIEILEHKANQENTCLYAYCGCPGGSGLTKLLFDKLGEALERTLTILKECKCTAEIFVPATIQMIDAYLTTGA